MAPLTVTYDKVANAAYLYLQAPRWPGCIPWRAVFPASTDDDDWSLTEAKGWIDLTVRSAGGEKTVSFYDPARLAQEIQDAMAGPGYFAESAIVVVPAVTRDAITAAVARLG